MSQMPCRGPWREIVATGEDKKAARGEPRFVLKLACGHLVRRYLVRIQNRGMARCYTCARPRRAS